MSRSVFEFNILKQFLFGIGYAWGSWSLCFGIFSIVLHTDRGSCDKMFSYYNEFADKE